MTTTPTYPSAAPPGVHRFALIGLLFAVVAPLLPIGHWIAPGASLGAMLARESVWWLYGAALIVWLRTREKLPLCSIGLRLPTGKTFGCALLGTIALLAVFAVHFAVIVPQLHLDASGALAERNLIMHTPYWFRVLLVLRAAVIEEIIFRGYIIEKILQLTGSTLLALSVSVATFTFAHLSKWGAVHLIPVFGAGIVLALLYLWRRDLASNMTAHFLTDAAGFLLQ